MNKVNDCASPYLPQITQKTLPCSTNGHGIALSNLLFFTQKLFCFC